MSIDVEAKMQLCQMKRRHCSLRNSLLNPLLQRQRPNTDLPTYGRSELQKHILIIMNFSILCNPFKSFIEQTSCKLLVFNRIGKEVRFSDNIPHRDILSVPKCTANQYCICLSIPQINTYADAVQLCGKFWDTQYTEIRKTGK